MRAVSAKGRERQTSRVVQHRRCRALLCPSCNTPRPSAAELALHLDQLPPPPRCLLLTWRRGSKTAARVSEPYASLAALLPERHTTLEKLRHQRYSSLHFPGAQTVSRGHTSPAQLPQVALARTSPSRTYRQAESLHAQLFHTTLQYCRVLREATSGAYVAVHRSPRRASTVCCRTAMTTHR